jgi:dTDP-glucose pyrophosphorylase
MLNFVIPMAGAGSRFKAEGYDLPKPFIDINGKMMIERVLDGIRVEDAFYTCIIQEQFKKNNQSRLAMLAERYRVVFATVENLTQGAACTALAAYELINNNYPVIFADSDNIFKNTAFRGFITDALSRGIDGSLLTFKTREECYSFVEADENGYAIRTKEKEAISNQAIAGVYMFRRGGDFVKCAINAMIYGDKEKGEYYMSNVCNYAIKAGLKIGVYGVGEDEWACVGTPAQLKKFLLKEMGSRYIMA